MGPTRLRSLSFEEVGRQNQMGSYLTDRSGWSGVCIEANSFSNAVLTCVTRSNFSLASQFIRHRDTSRPSERSMAGYDGGSRAHGFEQPLREYQSHPGWGRAPAQFQRISLEEY